jgi:quercetin dioxygenase-like cupin family protein
MSAAFFADGAGRFQNDPTTTLEYDASSLREVLKPGDVLFVPAGALHGTEALSDCSIGLSVFFML